MHICCKEGIGTINRYMRRGSTSLTNREMKINTKWHHLTPVRMAILKKTRDTSVDADMEKGNPGALWVGMWTGAAAVENSTRDSSKI